MITISYLDSTLVVVPPVATHPTGNVAQAFDTLRQGADTLLYATRGQLWQYCHRNLQLVRAAGGVVADATGKCIAIHRYGCWDLPKGMVEHGESLRRAAQREIEEECGLGGLTIGKLICKTYHIHNRYGQWQLKQTAWFEALCHEAEPPLTPQTAEDISQAVWMTAEQWKDAMHGSYATLRQVAQLYNRDSEQ